MKAVIILAVAVLLCGLIPGSTAEACWAYFSTEDLVERSDLIVIGEIKGISGTKRVENMWATCWDVEIQYYIKGNPVSSMLTVITPGVRDRQPFISIAYYLDEWGSTVLLFLVESKDGLQPLTPQGVVALTKKSSPPADRELSGEYLLEKYGIDEQKTPPEEKLALESFVAGLPRVVSAPEAGNNSAGGLAYSRYIFPAVLLVLALTGLVAVLRLSKKQN